MIVNDNECKVTTRLSWPDFKSRGDRYSLKHYIEREIGNLGLEVLDLVFKCGGTATVKLYVEEYKGYPNLVCRVIALTDNEE